MKINKELILKANIILMIIVILDEFLIIGAYQGIMTTTLLYYDLQKNFWDWMVSAIMINLAFVLPLSLWIKQKAI